MTKLIFYIIPCFISLSLLAETPNDKKSYPQEEFPRLDPIVYPVARGNYQKPKIDPFVEESIINSIVQIQTRLDNNDFTDSEEEAYLKGSLSAYHHCLRLVKYFKYGPI